MLTSSLFFSLQTQHDQSRGNTNTTKQKQTKGKEAEKRMCSCSLCRSVLCQVMWHSSSCSLNELLTPVLRADVSTGKLDSRFPVNKPLFLWSAPVAFRRVALETPEWTSRDSNHHRQSVSAGKTNAIPTEPSGRLFISVNKFPVNKPQVLQIKVCWNYSSC